MARNDRATVCELLVRALLDAGWHSLPSPERVRTGVRRRWLHWYAAVPMRRMGSPVWRECVVYGRDGLRACADHGLRVTLSPGNEPRVDVYADPDPTPAKEPTP